MDAVIIDVDGTLADVSSIRHYVRPGQVKGKNFDKFHEESVNCPPNAWVVDMAKEAHNEGKAVIIVTARKHKWRHVTAWFLALNDIPSDMLIMRNDNDQRKDYDVKKDILSSIRAQGFNVVHAIDDNPAIIRLWEENNIPVTIVPGWKMEN